MWLENIVWELFRLSSFFFWSIGYIGGFICLFGCGIIFSLMVVVFFDFGSICFVGWI